MKQQQSLHRTSSFSPGSAPHPSAEALVIYDAVQAHNREIHLLSKLEQLTTPDQRFHFTWWNTTHLRHAHIAALAGDYCARSRFVVFELAPGTGIPDHVGNWLKESLKNSPANPELIFVSRLNANSHGSQAEIGLSKLAASLHLNFHNIDDVDFAVNTRSMATRYQRRSNEMTEALKEVLQHPLPAPRWGINE